MGEWMSLIWLIIFVVLLIIELATMGLTTIWFASGAVVALILSVLGVGFLGQAIAFVVVSAVQLFFTRPYAIQYFNTHRITTNAKSLIGQTAVVTEEIDNVHGVGQVVINGMEWTARAEKENQKIPEETKVRILEISGVKLIVTPEK